MATPTLDAYRKLHPEDTSPDEVVVPKLIQQFSEAGAVDQIPDLITYASQLGPKRNLVKEFTHSTVGGVDTAKAAFYSLAAQGADATGLDSAKDWALGKFQQSSQAAAQNAPSVPSVQDVHSVSDAVRYGVGLVGSQVPMIAGTAAATLGGALVGSAVGPEGTVAGGLEGAASALSAAQAAKNASAIYKAYQALQGAASASSLGARVGGQLAAGLAGYAQSQNYAQLALSGADDPLLTSAATGVAGGLMMSVVPTRALRSAFGAEAPNIQQATMEQFIARAEKNIPGVSGYIALHGAEHAANGSMLMMGQELAVMAGEAYAHRNDPNFQITDDEIAHRLINGATAGAMLGATFGIAGGPSERNNAIKEQAFAAGLKSLYEAGVKRDAVTAAVQAKTQPIVKPAPPAPTVGTDPFLFSDGASAAPDVNDAAGSTLHMGVPNPDAAGFVDESGGTAEPARPATPPAEPAPAPSAPVVAAKPTPLEEQAAAYQKTIKRDPNAPENQLDFAYWLKNHGVSSPMHDALIEAEKQKVKPQETAQVKLPEPQIIAREAELGKLPELRAEMMQLPLGSTLEDIEAAGQRGIRGMENTKKTTKKFFVAKDNVDGSVKVFPVFKSTGNKLRLDNAVDAVVKTQADFAKYLNEPLGAVKKGLAEGGARGESLKQIFEALRKGAKEDQYLDEFLNEKLEDGSPRYAAVGFLDALHPAGGKHYAFGDAEAFRNAVGGAEMPGKISSKDNMLGTQGTEEVLGKIKQLNPDEAAGVTLLASFLESVPKIQARLSGVDKAHLGERAQRAESDSVAILSGLLRVPDARVFGETLNKITDPTHLFRISKGRLFGLFTPSDWQTFKQMMANSKIEPQELLNYLDRVIKEAGWASRESYLEKVTKGGREKQLGGSLEVIEREGAGKAEDEGLTGMAEDTAFTEEAASPVSTDTHTVIVAGSTEDGNQHDIDGDPGRKIPEKAEGVAGLTKMETGALSMIFKDVPQRFETEVRNILEARADSEIGDPAKDLEFQAVKGDLKHILQTMLSATRVAVPKMTDAFLYGVYSNLDRIQRDSRPERTTYRATSDAVQQKFQNVVRTLAGMGIDTRLIDATIDPSIEFLQKNWGRAIAYEDGRRMIVMGIDDINRPTLQNLQTLLHETAHHILAEEQVWMQKLIHEAVERLADLQGEVFSKTWDRRIARGNPDNMPIGQFYEEVLVEHLAHFGVDQPQARTIVQKLIDGVTKVIAQAVAVYSKLRGYNVAPELTRRYTEIRMQDFLDRAFNSEHDLDTLAGNVRETADYQATFYKRVGGELGEYGYDPDSGNMYLKDVVDDSVLASRFNLDNKLQFHDVVVRNSEADKLSPEELRKRTFGLTAEPQKLSDVLKAIVDYDAKGPNTERLTEAARLLTELSDTVDTATIKIASSPEDFELLDHPVYGSSGGIYAVEDHQILISPSEFEAGKRVPGSLAYLILHEAVHAATSKAIEMYLTAKKYPDMDAFLYIHKIEDMAPEKADKFRASVMRTMDAVDKINRIYKSLTPRKELRSMYGMETLHEFVAEMMSHREFQARLLQTELPVHLQFFKGITDTFKTLVQLIGKAVGLGPEAATDNAKFLSDLSALRDKISAAKTVEERMSLTRELYRLRLKNTSLTPEARSQLAKIGARQLLEDPGQVSQRIAQIIYEGDKNFIAGKDPNALVQTMPLIEEIIRAQNAMKEGKFGMGKRYFLPATEAESDRLVKQDYETHFSRLNTQADFYKQVLKPLADASQTEFYKYLSKVLGIFNPEKALEDVQLKLGAEQRPLQVNEQLRLTDVAGEANMVKSEMDRKQLTKELVQTVTNAQNKMTRQLMELTTNLPELKKELERQRERFVRFETILHDVAAVRDNAVKTFRRSLNEVKGGTRRMLEWSARHDGLAGVAKELFRIKADEELPEHYGELIEESVAENSSTFQFTDILTSLVKHGVDYDIRTPVEIEREVQKLAKTTSDPKMIELADASPKARADLALAIYYAKTNPVDMAAMEIRIEKDPERKGEILRRIQKIIRGNYESLGEMNDLFKTVRAGDVKVGKAQRAMIDAEKRLKATAKQLQLTDARIVEMNKAAITLSRAVRPYIAELGIRGETFSATNGSKIIRTPNPFGQIVGHDTLKLGKDADTTVVKILMENIAWLKANEHLKDDVWLAVNDQVEGLKKVAGDFTYEKFRDSFYVRALESLPARMQAIGHPLAKLASNRVYRWLSKIRSQERIVAEGYKTGEMVTAAMKALGFANGYDGFRDIFWNPANHFRQHLKLLPSADPAEQALYSKGKLLEYFRANEATRELLQKAPGGFDVLWDALEQNASTSKKIANLAAEWNALVEDTDIKFTDPRTQKETYAKRPALDVGYGTTQRSLMKKGIWIKRLLEDVKGPANNSLWAEWAQGNVMADPKALFTEEVLRSFVRPYIYDTSTLHLNGPELVDGKTRTRAHPMNVQAAFEASNGDMVDFANRLFDLEDVAREETPEETMERRKAYVESTLGFFRGQYEKLYNLTKRQEMFNKEGIELLSSPMMDNRKMDDLPAEFIDYYIYDKSTVHGMVNNLAAHSELGRDLGQFDHFDVNENKGILWELAATSKELELQQGDYVRMVENALRENPKASSKQIDAIIEAKVGKQEFGRLKELVRAQMEVNQIADDLKVYFTRPNGSTRELNIAQRVIGLTTAAMTSSLKTALLSTYQIFEPFNKYGVGKVGATQVARNMTAFLQSGAGSIVQGLTGQAKLASQMAREMNMLGIGLDSANEVTPGQIVADPGKNNVYSDQRLLGWLTKMRGLVFDTGIKAKEGERIAPALRLQAPAATVFQALNQAGIEGELKLYNQVFGNALKSMEANPLALVDPNFKFTPEHINLTEKFFDKVAFDELQNELKIMGTTLEIEARALAAKKAQGIALGNTFLSPDMARLIASRAMDSLSLHSSVGTVPIWAFNSKVGQLAMPLLRWPLAKMNQLVGSIREPNGEVSRRAMINGAAMLMLGAVPSAIAISLLLDQYDEHALGKKSNLIGFNWDSPSQTAAALTERLARVGTFGLLGDVINGVRVYGTDGDLRGISLDQRIVFANSILSVIGLANTAINQRGTLTYDTFYRPLINLMGGTGILQDQEIINQMTNSVMGVPVFTAEAQSTARINAINYLRGAGRVLNLNVRNSNGMASLPNPEKPWVNQMVVSAYTNDRSQFVEAYNKAVEAAREEGRPDPVDHVKRAFQSYHPLRYVFQTPPSQAEVSQIFTTLSDKGKDDVQSALYYFNAYAQSLGLKPYTGKETVTGGSSRPTPSAFAPLSI